MCTRDWQRSTTAPTTEGSAGLSYVITLEADGSFGRSFIGCSCNLPSEAIAATADRAGRPLAALGRLHANPFAAS
jgi:hypothetical protein